MEQKSRYSGGNILPTMYWAGVHFSLHCAAASGSTAADELFIDHQQTQKSDFKEEANLHFSGTAKIIKHVLQPALFGPDQMFQGKFTSRIDMT